MDEQSAVQGSVQTAVQESPVSASSQSDAPQELQLQQLQKGKGTKITKLIMDGFKSFGKRTELYFGDDFNVILGPNGSGKSNVIDALCFVLGKSSSKSLRAEKSAHLIYNGGKTKNPAKVAEVSICFDNKNKIFPLPDEEIKLTRLVRHDGMSKYKINNKTHTRQEVLDLLSAAKINPNGYNIILQGDIVGLVEMSAVERRQIVEEIAGISIYEEKKQQALNELTKVDQKLSEAEIIMKERESNLRELKRDREHALKYKDVNDKIRKNKASCLKQQMTKKEQEEAAIREKSEGCKAKFDELKTKIGEHRTHINDAKEKIAKISNEIEQKSKVEQIQLLKDIEQLRVDLASSKTRLSSSKNEIAKLQQRRQQLKTDSEELSTKIAELEKQQIELTEQKKSISEKISEFDKTILHFKEEHHLNDSNAFEKSVEELDKQADEKQKALQTLREQQQNFIRECDRLDFQIQAIDEKVNKMVELEKEHHQEISLLKHKKEEFKKTVLELNELLNTDSQMAGKLAGAKSELAKDNENLAKLEVKNAGIQESIAGNVAVKKILESKNKFGEVYGTVAELGQTPSKFSLALEIAASQKIHSVVVEDDKVAARCISYLKENKFGVVTFLPLNKIKPQPIADETKAFAKEKGVHGFAIDLITFEPKFKNVFSYVFGNTLVVDNIEVARKIGIGRAKMVTLDGDLAETSGAMIGGYRHKKTGSFKEQELSSELEKLREQVANSEMMISKLEETRRANEEKITRLRELRMTLEGEIIKNEKSLHLESGDLDASKQFKEDLLGKKNAASKQMKEIENKADEVTRELTAIKIKKQEIKNKISELRNPAVLAELNAFEQKRKELSENIIAIDGEQKTIMVQLTDVFGRDKENMQNVLNELDKEEKKFKEETQTLEKTIKEYAQQLEVKDAEQQKFFAQFKSLFEEKNALSEQANKHETAALRLEESSRQEELLMNTYAIEAARVRAEHAGLSSEFSQYAGIELELKKTEEQLKKEIEDFEKVLTSIGTVNMRALEIYDAVEKEYKSLQEKKSVLIREKEDVLKMMSEIETNKTELFVKTLAVVDKNFRSIFSAISAKGEAFLELENPEQPFEQGLRIKVRISGSKFLDIRSLSGGEKTMTALAFLFAIQEHEPATFYVMDEVDAALDKHNSEKLGKLIRKYCDKAQYIVISHNDAITMEADILYGVSMNPELGISNVVSLRV